MAKTKRKRGTKMLITPLDFVIECKTNTEWFDLLIIAVYIQAEYKKLKLNRFKQDNLNKKKFLVLVRKFLKEFKNLQKNKKGVK